MKTDDLIDLIPDPEIEDALRNLYAQQESRIDADPGVTHLLVDARLDVARPVARERGNRRRWVPAVAAVAVLAMGSGLWLADTPLPGSQQGFVLSPGAPPLSPAPLPPSVRDEELSAAERQAERERALERDRLERNRQEAEENAALIARTETATELAARTLARYESALEAGDVELPMGHGYSTLVPVSQFTLQDEGRSISMTADPAPDDAGDCRLVYGASSAESDHAVVIAAFAVESLRVPARSCVESWTHRVAEVTLDSPVGDRILIDAATFSTVAGSPTP